MGLFSVLTSIISAALWLYPTLSQALLAHREHMIKGLVYIIDI